MSHMITTSPTDDPENLVSTDWLATRMGTPELRILDASWHMPTSSRNAKEEYKKGHIPGAQFFDIDEISDQRSDLPHMVPPIETFVSYMREMGVGDEHQIVIYDTLGLFSAARVWWLFRLMGKTSVAVLDGGLPKWLAEGKKVESTVPKFKEKHMTVTYKPELRSSVTQVAHCSKLKTAEILDARPKDRFDGTQKEPREGLRSGHIPNSKNIPFPSLLNENKTLKQPDELLSFMRDAKVDLSRPIITTCGSGVTAAIISLALERIGHREHALYDGSWAEWGMHKDLNIECGQHCTR